VQYAEAEEGRAELPFGDKRYVGSGRLVGEQRLTRLQCALFVNMSTLRMNITRP
jgi:hypothetical protein